MNATSRAAIAALTIALATGTSLASAQTATPAAVAPRLIAPNAIAFRPGDATARGVTKAAWSSASGTWQSSTEDGVLSTRASFNGLVPNGHYSLFSHHTAGKSTVIAPLDRSGTTNSFIAGPDGSAVSTVTVSQALVAGDEVWLVYHADGADHPMTIGKLGTDAFIQLRLIQT
jgi:hypothetical protein